MVFTTSYESLAPSLQEDQAVLIRGSALPEEGSPTKVSIKEIIPLDVLMRIPLPGLISIQSSSWAATALTESPNCSAFSKKKPGETLQVHACASKPRETSP